METNILNDYPVAEVSVSQQMLINQNVAFTFERLVHSYILCNSKEARAYGTYLCLLNACGNKEYFGNYLKALSDYVDEEILTNVVSYIRMGEVPYHLFVNKVMNDVQRCGLYYSKASMASLLLIMLLKTMRASLIAYNKLHRALMEDFDTYDGKVQNVINFAYSWYLEYPQQLKEDYMKALHPETDKARQAALANEVSIFTEVLVDMYESALVPEIMNKAEEGLLPKYTALWKEKMDISFMLNGDIDEGDLVTSGGPRKHTVGDKMSCFATDLCGWGPNGETPEQMEEQRKLMEQQEEADKKLAEDNEENPAPDTFKGRLSEAFTEIFSNISALRNRLDALTEKVDSHINEKYNDITSGTDKCGDVSLSNEKQIFILKKVAKDGSSRVMWKGKYNTLEEAKKRKEELCNNPDIIKNFDFVIEKESSI